MSRELTLNNMYMIKANSTAVTKITSVQWITPNNKSSKQVVKSLEEWAAKILCQDNNYLQDLANTDEETKKHFQMTKNIRQINMLGQLHPTNQTIRRQVTMSILSGSHQNNNDTNSRPIIFASL